MEVGIYVVRAFVHLREAAVHGRCGAASLVFVFLSQYLQEYLGAGEVGVRAQDWLPRCTEEAHHASQFSATAPAWGNES